MGTSRAARRKILSRGAGEEVDDFAVVRLREIQYQAPTA